MQVHLYVCDIAIEEQEQLGTTRFETTQNVSGSERESVNSVSFCGYLSLVLHIPFIFLFQSIVENPMMNGEVVRCDGAIRMPP